MATTQQVQALYIGLLGRAADQAGLNFWIQDIASGNRTLNDVQKEFAASPEFAAAYGAITDRTALVSTIYSNLFERAPDAAGLAYWVGTNLTADQLIASFIQYASPADRTVLTNKTLVAEIYTSVAGGAATFKVADAANVVANVNGTPASVTAAVGSINTLPGVVTPTTINAIKALEAAVASQTAYETNKANLDALVALNTKAIAVATKAGVAAPPAVLDSSDDGTVAGDSWAEVSGVAAAAAGVRAAIAGATPTNVLQANADNAAGALASSKQALVLTLANGAALVSAYESAAAAAAAAQPPAAAAKTAALADLNALQGAQDAAWDAAIAASGVAGVAGLTATSTGTDVYNVLAGAATLDTTITALKNAIAASGMNDIAKNAFTTAANLAAVERADNQATVKANAALADLNTAATAQGATAIAAVGDYTTKAGANATAQATLASAKEADALKVEADALAASYKAVTDATASANGAVATLAPLNLKTGADADASKAVNEVFYFATKAAASDDYLLDNFAKGDSIYVGNGLTHNNGALSTGNNNALEFFLVKNGANVEVIVETEVYGSASTTITGGVVASPDAAVITLVGVTVEQLSVSNGVISFA